MLKSHQRCKEAEDGLLDLAPPRTTCPSLGGDVGALLLVGLEDATKADGGVGVVHEGIDLEIVLETTEIDVGGAYGGEGVVDNHGLGMKET